MAAASARCHTTFSSGSRGYADAWLANWVVMFGGLALELVRGQAGPRGFAVQPKCWIVERTFAWLNQCRRLSKDYEELPETSEVLILIAMSDVMLKRLAK